ncbi:hypothetical protein HPP92_007082, partial [Vanilla planifolia]
LLRCGKSCRLRWVNYLRPGIKHGNYSQEEEDTIIQLHRMLGNQWAKIASFLPGRTDNEIKNIWNTYLRKRFAPNNGSLAFQKTFSYSATMTASVAGEARCSVDGDAPNPSRTEAETSIDMFSDLDTPDVQPLQRDSSQEQFHCMISSSTLSTPAQGVAAIAEDLNAQWGERPSAIDEIDIDSAIDPDFWNDTINSFTSPATISNTLHEGKVPIDFDESERWMVELAEELGLFKDVHGMEEVMTDQGREQV